MHLAPSGYGRWHRDNMQKSALISTSDDRKNVIKNVVSRELLLLEFASVSVLLGLL